MKLFLTAPLALGLAGSLATMVMTSAGELERMQSGTGEGCDAFAWPVAEERAWFADQNLRRKTTGARLARIDRAVELTLGNCSPPALSRTGAAN